MAIKKRKKTHTSLQLLVGAGQIDLVSVPAMYMLTSYPNIPLKYNSMFENTNFPSKKINRQI